MARGTKNLAVIERRRSTKRIGNDVIVMEVARTETPCAFLTRAIRTEGGSGFDAGWKFMSHLILSAALTLAFSLRQTSISISAAFTRARARSRFNIACDSSTRAET